MAFFLEKCSKSVIIEKHHRKETKMNIEEIKQANTKYIGKDIVYDTQIPSTHKKAEELAKKRKIENGTIFLAEEQTAGIGTKGRSWYTGKENIAMTIVVFPKESIQALEGLTTKLAQAMQETIKELYGYHLEIKLPNDLLFHKKKICGILTQCATQQEKVQYLLISIGFNVNEEKFSEETKEIATSLKKETKQIYSREKIIRKWIEKVEKILVSIF